MSAHPHTHTPSYSISLKFCTVLFIQMFNSNLKLFDNSVLLSLLLVPFCHWPSLLFVLSLSLIFTHISICVVSMYVFAIFILSSFLFDINLIMGCQLFFWILSKQPALSCIPHVTSNCDVFLVVSISFLCASCVCCAQFWGCFPFVCFHPGAHPVLGRGTPSAPGPAAESPAAPYSPAPSGS